MLLAVFYNSPEDSLEGAAASPRDAAEILERIGSKETELRGENSPGDNTNDDHQCSWREVEAGWLC